jgi:hypothetical protein
VAHDLAFILALTALSARKIPPTRKPRSISTVSRRVEQRRTRQHHTTPHTREEKGSWSFGGQTQVLRLQRDLESADCRSAKLEPLRLAQGKSLCIHDSALSMGFCNQCGTQVPPNGRFCNKCGAPQQGEVCEVF